MDERFLPSTHPYHTPIGRTICISLFIMAMIGGTLLGTRLTLVAGYPLPAGALLFPWSYCAFAVLTEVYGPRYALRLASVGILCLALFRLYVFVALSLPDPHISALTSRHAAEFNDFFSADFVTIFVTIMGTLAGQMGGVMVYWFLHDRYHNALWQRLWAMQVVASTITVLIGLTATFLAVTVSSVFVHLILVRIVWGVLFATVTLPLVRYAAMGIDKLEHVGDIDPLIVR